MGTSTSSIKFALLICALAGTCHLLRASEDAFERAIELIHAGEGEPAGFKATQAALRSVLDLLDKWAATSRQQVLSQAGLEVLSLYEASRLGRSKCKPETFDQLDSLVAEYQQPALNLGPYLERLLDLCQPPKSRTGVIGLGEKILTMYWPKGDRKGADKQQQRS